MEIVKAPHAYYTHQGDAEQARAMVEYWGAQIAITDSDELHIFAQSSYGEWATTVIAVGEQMCEKTSFMLEGGEARLGERIKSLRKRGISKELIITEKIKFI